jgi:TolB protein
MTGQILPPQLGVPTCRRPVCIGAAVGMLALAERPACAILFNHPVLRKFLPVLIALPDFLVSSPADAVLAGTISPIIASNLERSRQFTLIDQAAFTEKITDFDVPPRFPEWRRIDAQAVVTGRVAREPDGRITVAFRLWDVFGGGQLEGRQYVSMPDDIHSIANIISDAFYERAIGEKNNFDSSTSP